ncbi:MAG: EAL domain-containing protein [Acidobacteriota bacterium]|nr:EAL domain-containing protein [Acidobacteriota bacterium]
MDSGLLRKVIEHSECGKILLDDKSRIQLWNRWMEEKSGKKSEEVKDLTLSQVFGNLPPRLLHAVEDAFQGLSATISSSFTPHPLPLRNPGSEELLYQKLSVRGFRGGDDAFLCMIEVIDVSPHIHRHESMQRETKRLSHRAGHDPLTGLANRELFLDFLNKSHARARRRGARYAVMFLDLANFKEINDKQGHQIGDQVLTEVAGRLRQTLRKGDVIARMSGDQFTILVESHQDPRHGAVIAEKVISVLSEPVLIENRRIAISTKVGIATYPEAGDNPESVLQNADVALMRAKQDRNTDFHFFTSRMNEEAREQRNLERDLILALENNEFELFFQPQLDLRSQHVVGAEALLRWRHPTMGLVSPGRFLPLANETGLILPIGEWVLKAALTQYSQWDHNANRPLRMGVNISGRQFNESGVLELLDQMLQRTGIDPSFIELELTEEVMINRDAKSLDILRGLRDIGVNIAIDDFGTGYSSLSYLKDFPLDTLKIDRSFIERVSDNERDAIITRTIIGLAHDLGLKVVAEGVENQDQLPFLRSLRCDEVQGYFFSKPLPADQFWEYLRRTNGKN